jgi:DNA-3-methyladenine glycosylase
MVKLQSDFYLDEDVTKIARLLLGKNLMVRCGNQVSGGTIVETEAYSGAVDKASHAYKNKLTERTRIMFETGGRAYVYLCYGIHHLFNVVTNKEGFPDAVLIRALQPLDPPVTSNHSYRNKTGEQVPLTNGPGKLSKALGIDLKHNGMDLRGENIWIEDTGHPVSKNNIVYSKRIGVDYAGDDAKLDWRFYLKDNQWISKK